MQCCANCFGDRELRDEITRHSDVNGDCPECGSQNQALIEARKLADYFELLIGIYRPAEGGKLLVEWLEEDWALFTHPNIDKSHAQELLAEILDDGEIVRQNFVPSAKSGSIQLDRWEQLKQELMHKNRFFPETEFDKARLESLLSQLKLDKENEPDIWFRARIEKHGKPYVAEEMGAPPKRIASHGRANPAGIPYLYLGSTNQTAVAEVRPHPGEKVCVAEFKFAPDLEIVDLRQPRTLISPFLLEDEMDIALLRRDIDFLESLGRELTTPVLPTAAAIDYIPSQYLCEFIKKCGFHGVIYNSSVSEGINSALFNPENAQVGNVVEFCVTRVSVEMDETTSQ